MQGSIPTKIFRLAWHLGTQPNYVIRYTRALLASPLDAGVPWISYGAIDFIDGFLKPSMEVFEYGSGGSTLFFSSRARSVTSVEENALWRSRVEQKLRFSNVNNVTLVPSSWDSSQSDGDPITFQDEYVKKLDRQYDVILVDGQCGWPNVKHRIHCFRRAIEFVAPGGVVILDDSWRYDGDISQALFKDRKVFQSVGPARVGVTSTTVYFFR